MKQEFLSFIEALIRENPEKANELMTDNIKAYLDILKDVKDEKSTLTEKGRVILEFLQSREDVKSWKAKDIAEAMGTSSRGVSGTMRGLVTNGFCEKLADNPSVYALTDLGRNYKENT